MAASVCLPYKCCSWTVQFPLISLNKPCKTTPQNSVRLSFLPVLLHPELQICPAVAAAPLQAALRCRRCAPCCSSCCPSSGRSRGRAQRKEDNLSPFLVQFQISNKAGIFPEGFAIDVFIFMTNCLNASPLKFYNWGFIWLLTGDVQMLPVLPCSVWAAVNTSKWNLGCVSILHSWSLGEAPDSSSTFSKHRDALELFSFCHHIFRYVRLGGRSDTMILTEKTVGTSMFWK